ncbi:predicted protein [Plenodomus lingam JN3]|uniref:Predicted protein n=1 Tax=Leptosphaeria maculans (strain JN3 / isolate v23.1.3 / race Av1-4-5-6-7-8) TaxID=985895 RepID=E4ZXL0_LEPMJ|nr:predicted protein [Plenodomus lingam JN3]CBX95420.1 predicted protein [Plenodomus lingam JN3]
MLLLPLLLSWPEARKPSELVINLRNSSSLKSSPLRELVFGMGLGRAKLY